MDMGSDKLDMVGVTAMFAGAALIGLISNPESTLKGDVGTAWTVADLMVAEFQRRITIAASEEKEKSHGG